MKTVKLKINNVEIEASEGENILNAAKKASVNIPSLCKHPDLHATGACGICIVKLKGAPNMVRACCTPVSEGMEVITHDPEIVGVRRTVLELILSAHPNECLTCGRNGTCELQRLASEFAIRRESFNPVVPDIPPDSTTNSITLEPRKCIKCGRCITVCQEKQNVWALSFLERGIDTRIAPAGVTLGESPCVRCGQCSEHCPVGAIFEFDETEKVWAALSDPELYCIAQIAPAVRVSIGEAFGYPPGTNLTGQIYDALRHLGFKAVFDTNFGADVTIMEEASEFAHRFLSAPEKLPLITTCCPSWVDFMEKFHHDMIEYFSSCKSPHSIVGTLTKTYYAQKLGIDPSKIMMVSIMPCTSKKYEITRTGNMYASGMQDVDVALTTREFIRMLQQSGIVFNDLDPETQADSPLGEYSGAGVIFGTTGGVMEAALRTASYFITGHDPESVDFKQIRGLEGIREFEFKIGGHSIRTAVAHGLGNVETLISRVRAAREEGREAPYHFIEVMACPGGCIGGGGQSWNVDDAIRKKRAEGLFSDDRSKAIRLSHRNPYIQKLYEEFLGEPLGETAQKYLHTSYQARPEYKR
ncbi:MAG: ferredoxin [Lentisphaerae bacterium GWF2_45_14]|nr:MAG: ferredoxin [Lentisphaerae bacterium GWF2_45_14]